MGRVLCRRLINSELGCPMHWSAAAYTPQVSRAGPRRCVDILVSLALFVNVILIPSPPFANHVRADVLLPADRSSHVLLKMPPPALVILALPLRATNEDPIARQTQHRSSEISAVRPFWLPNKTCQRLLLRPWPAPFHELAVQRLNLHPNIPESTIRHLHMLEVVIYVGELLMKGG